MIHSSRIDWCFYHPRLAESTKLYTSSCQLCSLTASSGLLPSGESIGVGGVGGVTGRYKSCMVGGVGGDGLVR
jgi:hypothetical protein